MRLPHAGQQTAVLPDYIDVRGLSPYTFRDEVTFRVSRAALGEAERNGPAWKFYNIPLIADALEHPSRILGGLTRANYEDGFCYSLLPTYQWVNETTKGKPPPLKVFAVYVHPTEGGLFVLDWDWRIACYEEKDLPNKWEKDFTGVIWPTS
jgi:hypothetical protein